MDRSSSSSLRGAASRPLPALPVLALLVAGAVGPPPAAAPESEPAGETAGDPWRRDAAGREYRVERLEKDHVYRRLEDGRVLTRWGILLDFDGEDEDHVYYRVYRPPEGDAGGPRRSDPAQPPEPPPAVPLDAAWEALPGVRTLELVPLSRGLPRPAQWRNGLRLADVDGDGRLDLVLPPARKRLGGPVLLLGDGDGWRPWREANLPATGWDYGDVEVADFDGDGRPDLAFAMHLRGLLVLVQREGGRFEPWSEGLGLGRDAGGRLPFSSRALRAGDLDGDGRPDLVVLGEGPRLATGPQPAEGAYGLRLFRNLGDGRWEARGPLPGSERLFGQSLARGDLDGSGRAGFLAASDVGRLPGLLYSGPPGAAAARELALEPGFQAVASAIGPIGPEGAPGLAVATTGAAGGAWVSSLELLVADGAGGWRRRSLLRLAGAYRLTAVALADPDGDGRAALFVGTGDGRLLVLRREGEEWRREAAEPLEAHAGCRVYHVEAAVDADGAWKVAANRAGEPGGTAFLGTAVPGCPGGGGVHAWRLAGTPPDAPGNP